MAESKTLIQQLEGYIALFCDEYCKWPDSEEYKPKDEMDADMMYEKLMNEKCFNCPFDKII